MIHLALILLLAASVAGKIDVCSTGRNIYRIGSNLCPCTANNEGALRYMNKVLQICDGKNYVNVGAVGPPPTPPPALGTKDNPAKSCNQIYTNNRQSKSGVYYLMPGKVRQRIYCVMDSICGVRGGSLIMKMDGNKNTFHYNSNHWVKKGHYNRNAVFGGLDDKEMKLNAYHNLPLNQLCVGMRVKGHLRWLKIPVKAPSLHSLIADGKYRATSLGRNAWKTLLSDSSLQKFCNKEGFNVFVNKYTANARIGIVSNQEKDCKSPDSRIAFGGGGDHCGMDKNNSVGNEARCEPDNGNKHTKAFGYIVLQ